MEETAPLSHSTNNYDAVWGVEEILAVFFACSLIVFVAVIICYLVRRYVKKQLRRQVEEVRFATQRQRMQEVSLTTQLASRLQSISASSHQGHQCSSAPNDDHKDLAYQRSQEVSKNERAPQTSSQCCGHHIHHTNPPGTPRAASPLPLHGQRQLKDGSLCPQMFCPEICNEPDLMELEMMQNSLRYKQPDDISKKQNSLTRPRLYSLPNSTAFLTSHNSSTNSIKGPGKPSMLFCSAHSMTIPSLPSEEEKPMHRKFRLKSLSTSSPFDGFSFQSVTLSSFPGHTPEVNQCQSRSLSQLSVCVLANYTHSQRSISTSSDNGNNCELSLNQSYEKSWNLGPVASARTMFKSPAPGEFSFDSTESVFLTANNTLLLIKKSLLPQSPSNYRIKNETSLQKTSTKVTTYV
ncbi:uncharacterized protein [Palaemon carinicauda]|uniref:uncharacterized protein isoform X2 n=1 Tax=Palaemon carinicauda TaxID=392227 RepID=UPI0035B60A66